MNARLYFTTDSAALVEPIEEISRVSLVRDVDVEAGRLPTGAKGTVVSVYEDGAAYCVEFTSPFAALVTLSCTDVAAVREESRERFVTASDKVSS